MVSSSAIQEELEVELLPRVEWGQMRWLRHRVRTLPGEVFMARPSGRMTLGRPRTRLGGLFLSTGLEHLWIPPEELDK